MAGLAEGGGGLAAREAEVRANGQLGRGAGGGVRPLRQKQELLQGNPRRSKVSSFTLFLFVCQATGSECNPRSRLVKKTSHLFDLLSLPKVYFTSPSAQTPCYCDTLRQGKTKVLSIMYFLIDALEQLGFRANKAQ